MKSKKFMFIVLIFSMLVISNEKSFSQFGITKQEISNIENTGHQVQLWQILPEFTKKAEYEISIKHAAEGEKGSFYIIAWADTNNDGVPDKEIGRSNLFTAKNAGDWSSWIFKSVYDKIFVGNTWKQSDDRIYYQIDGKLEGYKGLSNKLFYSREFNGKPTQSVGPRFTNIKVSFKDIENDGFGVTEQEISNIENAGHQVQLWQILPEFTKKAEYEISIKHAAEGEKGSFYIIAWADTNNDGIPDKEIGRSNLFTAKNAGDWSSWAFKSEYDKIFVGNTWKQSDDRIYYQSGGNLKGYKGLSNKLFYSREFNGKPTQSTSPRYTNVKIKILK